MPSFQIEEAWKSIAQSARIFTLPFLLWGLKSVHDPFLRLFAEKISGFLVKIAFDESHKDRYTTIKVIF